MVTVQGVGRGWLYLLEGHPQGSHVDVGCYSAGVQVTGSAQDHTWGEGRDVCQTSRQVLLCEIKRLQFTFPFTDSLFVVLKKKNHKRNIVVLKLETFLFV